MSSLGTSSPSEYKYITACNITFVWGGCEDFNIMCEHIRLFLMTEVLLSLLEMWKFKHFIKSVWNSKAFSYLSWEQKPVSVCECVMLWQCCYHVLSDPGPAVLAAGVTWPSFHLSPLLLSPVLEAASNGTLPGGTGATAAAPTGGLPRLGHRKMK